MWQNTQKQTSLLYGILPWIWNQVRQASQNKTQDKPTATGRTEAASSRQRFTCCNLIGQLELLHRLGWSLEFRKLSWRVAYDLPDRNGFKHCYKMPLSLMNSSNIHSIHTSYQLFILFTHSLSSRCLTLAMVHWSCLHTLKSTRISQLSCIQQECLWLPLIPPTTLLLWSS